MRSIKTIIKGAAHRIKESCTMFGRRGCNRPRHIHICRVGGDGGQQGSGGFTKATQRKSARMRRPFPTL